MEQTVSSIFSLQDRDIWVIGGAGYLGQATVKLLLQSGAKVLCADLEDRAFRFADNMDAPARLTPATLDLRIEEEITRFTASQTAARGTPHGLVILAYASTAKHFHELSGKDFDEVNHGGLTSTFLMAREAGNAMEKAGRGNIVLFSSMYGSVSPDPGVYEPPMPVNPVEYGVGKAGIQQMTRYLAVHWARKGIRCNCISPGPFPNPHVRETQAGFIERLARKVPMGRIGSPEEVAGAVVFLLSDAAGYITGQNLFVDGGWTIW